MSGNKPSIIVISSHVVRGTVGNRAAAFALEVMGYPVWIVPTIILPWHPGHGSARRMVPAPEEFQNLIDDLMEAPWLGEVGAILSGYLGSVEQVSQVQRLVEKVKTVTPKAFYALDPVMGDTGPSGEGRLYVPEDQATAMRDRLLPLADLITPNPFELAWMSGTEITNNLDQLAKAAQSLSISLVLATSAPALMRGHMGNLLIEDLTGEQKAHIAEHPFANGPPNGMGDLAAALMLGNYLNGNDPLKALKKTSATLAEIMLLAARSGTDELPLEAGIASILHPRMPVTSRSLKIR